MITGLYDVGMMSESVKYSSLNEETLIRQRKKTQGSTEEFSEDQFNSQFYDSCAPPFWSIVRAVVLFVVGVILTVVGSLLLAGYFDATYADRTWPVLTIGLLCFIPGFYYSRIAYYAYKGYPGYSFRDIPGSD